MRYRKVGIYLLLLCFLGVCGGCQKTPQEVRERMGDYGENKQMVQEDVKYCTITELKKADLSDADVGLDNITLPQKVDFSEVESIGLLNLSFEKDYTENQPKVEELFGIDRNSLVSDVVDKEHDMGRTVVYDSSEDRKYTAIQDNGFVSFVSGLSYEYINDNAVHKGILEKYDLDIDDISGKKVEFADGKADIAAVLESAERWLDENMPVDYGEYHISDVYIRELELPEGTEKQISFYVELSYKGIRFNSYGSIVSEGGSQMETGCYGLCLSYDGIDQLSFFSNSVGRIRCDSVEQIERIVSPQSAVRLVSEEMSGFNQLDISKVLPLYVLYPKYRTDKELFSVPGQKVEGRPVYAFIIKDGNDDTEFGINKSNAYKVVFVDMVTGVITTNIR